MDAVLSLYSFRKISPALALGVRVKDHFRLAQPERAYACGGVRFVVAILLHFFRLHYGLLRQHALAGGRGRGHPKPIPLPKCRTIRHNPRWEDRAYALTKNSPRGPRERLLYSH